MFHIAENCEFRLTDKCELHMAENARLVLQKSELTLDDVLRLFKSNVQLGRRPDMLEDAC